MTLTVFRVVGLLSALLVLQGAPSTGAAPQTAPSPPRFSQSAPVPPLLWRDPTDIATRDLLHGAGGAATAPSGALHFVKEDFDGTNAKIEVVDDASKKWKLKMGAEAQSETAASRFVWAVGFFANADVYVAHACVTGMPTQLHRGQHYLTSDGCIDGARLKLEDHQTSPAVEWDWKQNPFVGSRELNGLRALMAVINNWDLKSSNNRVETRKDESGEKRQIYMVADLGASFGTAGLVRGHTNSRGNLEAYQRSEFILGADDHSVDFATPERPSFLAASPRDYFRRLSMRWIGHNIPREHARWLGSLLGRLTAAQIRDAFRGAGYSDEDIEGFALVVEQRIAALNQL